MSSDRPSGHLDDDRLSALIDGDGSERDAEHCLSCSLCARRLADWQEAALLIAEPVVVPAARRDSAVLAAMAVSSAAAAPGPTPVHSRRWLAPVAGLAAAVAVIGGIGYGLSHAHFGSNASTERSSTNASGGSSGNFSGSSSSGSGSSTGASESTSSPSGPANLGDLTTMAQVIAAVSPLEATAKPADGPETGFKGDTGCESSAVSAVHGPPATLVLTLPLTYRATAATVYVFGQDSTHVAVVTAVSGCANLGVARF